MRSIATPRGSWTSCEETTLTPAENSPLNPDRVSKRHGYNFEVPAAAEEPVLPEPLVAMGQFRHEAIAVDPKTGIVSRSQIASKPREKRRAAPFFSRFWGVSGVLSTPETPIFDLLIVYQTEDREDGLFYRFIPEIPGNLKAGRLEALRIAAAPQAITRERFPMGYTISVDWVAIEDVDPAEDTVRVEGFRKGAAQFSRGEPCSSTSINPG